MKANILDLRYKMKEILKALDRREIVEILYHGKSKGTIIPKKVLSKLKITEHEFFGMNKDKKSSVLEEMQKLRGGRFNDI